MHQYEFLDLAAAAVQRARKLGGDEVEAFLSFTRELLVEVRDGAVETLKQAEDRGLGVRVIAGGRLGFAFTTDLSAGGLAEATGQAVENARQAAPDRYQRLPDPPADYPQLELEDPLIRTTPIDEKVEMARRMEEAARAADRRVRIIETATYQDSETEITVVNSRGLVATARVTRCGLYVALVAGSGDEAYTGFAVDYRLRYADLDPEAVGREAAARAVCMLGAKPVGTRRVPVVLDPYVAASFLGVLAPSFSAEAVQKGRSLFAGRLGETVAAAGVTVIDDGALEGGVASGPFDGEGVPTRRKVLIDDGRLAGFLYHTYSAARDRVDSTGNAVRSSFKSLPEVGTTNFYLKPGPYSPEE
ncbi:MAG: TldD/PmbA family protein, partial [Firmicutes bacterium]|nr:TldD/PmbA family protein [Bacillota bacterium]